jgi:hypothetical protein
MRESSAGIQSVVPAKAGTHNHNYSLGAKVVGQQCFNRWDTAYGPGFRRDDSYIRCIDTETFGPFLMVW